MIKSSNIMVVTMAVTGALVPILRTEAKTGRGKRQKILVENLELLDIKS